MGAWFVAGAYTVAVDAPDEVDLAIEATLKAVMSEPEYPRDLETLNEVVNVRFSALYPGLTLQELRKDPAFVEAEAAAFSTISNPSAVYEELMKDEAYRRESEEAERTLTRGVEEGRANALKELTAQVAKLKSAREVELELMDNPEWRRQREEPVRALAPQLKEPVAPGE